MKHADIIIPFDTQNENAVEMLIQNLQIKMRMIEKQRSDYENGLELRTRTMSDLLTSPNVVKNTKIEQLLPSSADSSLVLPSEKLQSKTVSMLELLFRLEESEDNYEL